MSFLPCTPGDDAPCKEYFGSEAEEDSYCCFRQELIHIPLDDEVDSDDDNALDIRDAFIRAYADVGLPSKEGDFAHFCLNNWRSIYPGFTVPNNYLYDYVSDGFTYKGYCDGASCLSRTTVTVLA